jgi:hypothetical protein
VHLTCLQLRPHELVVCARFPGGGVGPVVGGPSAVISGVLSAGPAAFAAFTGGDPASSSLSSSVGYADDHDTMSVESGETRYRASSPLSKSEKRWKVSFCCVRGLLRMLPSHWRWCPLLGGVSKRWLISPKKLPLTAVVAVHPRRTSRGSLSTHRLVAARAAALWCACALPMPASCGRGHQACPPCLGQTLLP